MQRKRAKEQVEKQKEEEMSKIRAQKRMLEQRQRNLQSNTVASKRDKEEIELLRKQLAQAKEDAASKDRHHRTQTDRVNRQVGDLRTENQELREEISHYDAELRDLREQ